MIVNKTNYNPLEVIFKLLDKGPALHTKDLFEVRAELFKGGVIVEKEEEFEILLKELVIMQETFNQGK